MLDGLGPLQNLGTLLAKYIPWSRLTFETLIHIF